MSVCTSGSGSQRGPPWNGDFEQRWRWEREPVDTPGKSTRGQGSACPEAGGTCEFQKEVGGCCGWSGGSKAMWGWGGAGCCHLSGFNHIHFFFYFIFAAQATFIIHIQTQFGQSYAWEACITCKASKSCVWGGGGETLEKGGGDRKGKGGQRRGVEDPLPRPHLQGWPLDPAVTWAVTSSCQPWESHSVNSGLCSPLTCARIGGVGTANSTCWQEKDRPLLETSVDL